MLRSGATKEPRRPGLLEHPWAATRGTFAALECSCRASTQHHSGTPACARKTAVARQIRRVRREGGVDQQGAIHEPADTHRRVEQPPHFLAGGSHHSFRLGGGRKLAPPRAARRWRHLAGERPRGRLKDCHFTVLNYNCHFYKWLKSTKVRKSSKRVTLPDLLCTPVVGFTLRVPARWDEENALP